MSVAGVLPCVAVVLLLCLALAGCRTVGGEVTSIVVADKKIQPRWESRVVGITASPVTGRVVELRREEIVHEYWVKGTDGHWYRIGRPDWDAAAIGASLEIRPALSERSPFAPMTPSP